MASPPGDDSGASQSSSTARRLMTWRGLLSRIDTREQVRVAEVLTMSQIHPLGKRSHLRQLSCTGHGGPSSGEGKTTQSSAYLFPLQLCCRWLLPRTPLCHGQRRAASSAPGIQRLECRIAQHVQLNQNRQSTLDSSPLQPSSSSLCRLFHAKNWLWCGPRPARLAVSPFQHSWLPDFSRSFAEMSLRIVGLRLSMAVGMLATQEVSTADRLLVDPMQR